MVDLGINVASLDEDLKIRLSGVVADKGGDDQLMGEAARCDRSEYERVQVWED